ncbi:MAG: RluA family pseudouridine synthase [Thermomicrobiales bacterium]
MGDRNVREMESGEEEVAEVFELRPQREDRNTRLDRYISTSLPDLSRTYLQSLIEQGHVVVDGQVRRPAFKITEGEVVTVSVPPTAEFEVEPEDIPLDIVYEDADVVVVNKPAGMVVHPAPGHPRGTLVNAMLAHAPDISIIGSSRPGIVHRLDKETSGLIIVAKTNRAQMSLVDQWQERSVEKRYITLVSGQLEEEEATVDAPVGRDPANRQRMDVTRSGRHAVSHFAAAQRYQRATLIDASIETGRTHQIRVHLAFIGHSVVGDSVYGGERAQRLGVELGLTRQFLHASELGLTLPDGTRHTFTAPLPDDLTRALALLEPERVDLEQE